MRTSYSILSTASISGAIAAVTSAGGMVAETVSASVPHVPPAWFIAISALIMGAIAAALMMVAVLAGLRLARCTALDLRYVLGIPVLSLLIVGILVTRPIKSQAIVMDLPPGDTAPPSFLLPMIPMGIVVVLIPIAISYAAGRLARTREGH